VRAIHHAALLLLAVASFAGASSAQPLDSRLSGFDEFAGAVLNTWEAPGLAVAVVKDGRVLLERGFGTTLAGGTQPVDEHTVFAIASTTKAFTAAAAGILVDEGRLGWDDRVIEHLPGFQMPDPWVTRELTVRDLLSHRSGLPRGDHLWYLSALDREEVVGRVRLLEPATSFRSRYGYQNIMFITAGEVIEAASDRSWDAFLTSRILEPLGMSRTGTSTSDLVGSDNVATPHVRLDGGVVPIPWPDFDNVGAAGAVNSSVHDLSRWLQVQLGKGTRDGLTLWSDSVAREMWTPNTVVPLGQETRRTHPETHLQAYGMGWFLQDYRGRLVVRHGGSLDGMRAHVALVPEEGLGVVALTNLNESRLPVAVVWEVIDRFLEPRAKPRDWNALLHAEAEREREASQRRQTEREKARVTGTSPSLPLEAYAGLYRSALSGDLEVDLEEGTLRLAYGPNYLGTLAHWHYDTWRVTWQNRSLGSDLVSFQLGSDGTVESLALSGTDRFRRAPAEPAPGGPSR
jgi:CubicO group peptidase (beta-lactamase class C family)